MSDSKPFEQVHLKGRGFSGRGVRYRVLPAEMTSHFETQVARTFSKDVSQIEFGAAIVKMALEQLVLAVTEPVVADKLATAKWKTVTPDELHANWDAYFNAKDTEVLRNIYTMEHTVTKDELEAIMSGKVSFAPDVPVTGSDTSTTGATGRSSADMATRTSTAS